MKPAIIVAAYDRPESLGRLLHSIASAVYPDNVPLLISIDSGGARQKEVIGVAEAFEWKHGVKEIIKHDVHLGLTRHFNFIGSLANKYGSVIRLEDDHYLSPVFYEYAFRALDFYRDDPRVAAISLYNVRFNGITKEPFIPYPDDGDVYFMQSPWSHGQAFLVSQWNLYSTWQRQFDPDSWTGPLHDAWAGLDKDEWFPMSAKYLVDTDRFYIFPRESLCTNFGDAGSHFKKASRYFQVPLQTRRHDYRFHSLDDCFAVYDAFQEMRPDRLVRLANELSADDFELDLNGTKSHSDIRRPYVITAQPCVSPIRTWGLSLYPREANVVENIQGSDLKLCQTENIRPGGFGGLLARFHLYEYAHAQSATGIRKHLLYWTIGQIEKILSWYRRDKR